MLTATLNAPSLTNLRTQQTAALEKSPSFPRSLAHGIRA